jgi:NitT/TauT family transport system substrate-binding protein
VNIKTKGGCQCRSFKPDVVSSAAWHWPARPASCTTRERRAAEGALETTTVHIAKFTGICLAPQFIAEELLRAEGFTDIRYVDPPRVGTVFAVASGQVDIDSNTPWTLIRAIDAREPITVLAGVMVGYYELFAHEHIRGIADMKGRSVGVEAAGPTRMGFPFLPAAHVGLNPDNDIHWVTDPDAKPLELFVQGKIDAFLAFPPEPQELRARKAGRVIFSTAVDLPWSQYFCCTLVGNRDYVRTNPVATKRVIRAILKAADLCAAEPARAARQMVAVGLASRYDYVLQTISELPYDKWREYDPEDTIRFYALRLHETGFIKSSPQKIIADGADWRFLNELKRELKV